MQQFIEKFQAQIVGVLSGFDRLVLRGSVRRLDRAYYDPTRGIVVAQGMQEYLWQNGVLFKHYGDYVKKTSERVKKAAVREYEEAGLPVISLREAGADKDQRARQVAQERGITSGPVCVLSALEPCPTFDYVRSKIAWRRRPCHVLYQYRLDEQFGWMYARIQTWFPFPVQICVNGREWLAQQMEAEGLHYVRQDNCFPWIEDFPRAQQLLDQQVKANWREHLDAIADQLHPLRAELFDDFPASYYWSTYQSEWATDLVFRHPTVLKRLYPLLLQHAMTTFASPDVMCFLGHKVPLQGGVHGNFQGEVRSDLREREEGIRVKHSVNGNSVKAYGKALRAEGSVFRVETTVNCAEDFKVYRRKEGDRKGPKAWRGMRRGIADLPRRARVSQQCNERYLGALSSVEVSPRLEEVAERLEGPTKWKGKRVRGLHPFSGPDSTLFQAISRGEWTVRGFRNRDLQPLLMHRPPASDEEKRRRSAWVSRQIRLLRAHGLIQKVPHENRYHLTAFGRVAVTTVLTARQANVSDLNKKAA